MTNRALAVAVIVALAVVVSALFAVVPAAGQGTGIDQCMILYPDGTWHYIDCPPTPTPEVFPTVTVQPPTPTITPSPEPVCMIGAVNYNVNVRTVPGGTQIGLFEIGAATEAVAQTQWGELRYYKVWWFNQWGWLADYVAETGPCESLPYEDPF